MYLLLSHPEYGGIYSTARFTEDLSVVKNHLNIQKNIVYKLDSLTRVLDVEITYQEITEETKQ